VSLDLSHAGAVLTAWFPESLLCVERVAQGLVHDTYRVLEAGRWRAVLQRVNTRVFPPEVTLDIDVVTTHLARRGMTTPQVLRTTDQRLWLTDQRQQVWRLLTPVGETTLQQVSNPTQAHAAGVLLGRFHDAVGDLDWQFHGPDRQVHDTAVVLQRLRTALAAHAHHRLRDLVEPLADQLTQAWEDGSSSPDLPRRIVHGDPKISNLRFVGDEAVALIDLDTVRVATLDLELGDALRSWCNSAGEDSEETGIEIELFTAALAGYAQAREEGLTGQEWEMVLPGLERVCLNLAARFAADALEERYFAWNPEGPGRGEQNLLRARGQVRLLDEVRRRRGELEQVLNRTRSLS